jgi:hypothetical protein
MQKTKGRDQNLGDGFASFLSSQKGGLWVTLVFPSYTADISRILCATHKCTPPLLKREEEKEVFFETAHTLVPSP